MLLSTVFGSICPNSSLQLVVTERLPRTSSVLELSPINPLVLTKLQWEQHEYLPHFPREKRKAEWPGPTPAATPHLLEVGESGSGFRQPAPCPQTVPATLAFPPRPSLPAQASVLICPTGSLAVLVVPHSRSRLSVGFLSGPAVQKAVQGLWEVEATGSGERVGSGPGPGLWVPSSVPVHGPHPPLGERPFPGTSAPQNCACLGHGALPECGRGAASGLGRGLEKACAV